MNKSIADFNFFRHLSDEQKKSLELKVHTSQFQRGDVIISRGSKIEFIYFIVSGRIRESTTTHSGKEVVFNTLSEGDSFGLVSPVKMDASRSDFIAGTVSHLFALNTHDFLEVMRMNESVTLSVVGEFISMAEKLAEKLYELRALDVSQRTRAEILRFASSRTENLNQFLVDLTNLPTHEEIANTIFSHREAVTKEMSRLRKTGIITKGSHNKLVADLRLLQQICPRYI